ncbi:copper amine oxidase N-terminal domain-containing protein [Tumebacillus sp. ITR2]|uniref:Copper amine oxidase N-terminal domain-containing protein n=1 Tax=Tumebacillus amylolyticus TaxID=2801339 RepID=A0ABS1JFM1_9BACL|nr:copper amine oxidase N-terminal domain-containing protein [Tumebacillus amylolyticus]MBL0389052.1 copper amine oxidase N-terminal domain-containing protein [Tumebacillus amylolyticus]
MKLNSKLAAGILTTLTMCATLSPASAFAHDSDMHMGNSMMPTGVLAQATAVSTTPAANLRVALDELFSEHANLAIIAMQKGYDGAPDFADAAAALNKNTDDLSSAIASVYGDAAGAQFKTIWSSHIGYFVNYVTATVKKDDAGKQQAIRDLAEYRDEQAKFLADANPNLNEKAVADGLQMHIDGLLAAFNAYVNQDAAAEQANLRMAHEHMFMTGDGISTAIVKQFPEKFNNTMTASPSVDLRVVLDRLLSEHASLAILAMQKGIDGKQDFGTVAATLNANTDDLSAAVGSVYGADAGAQFKKIWSSHIGYFVDYVKATAAKDSAGQQKAVANLDEYRTEQAKFFAGADPYMNETAIREALNVHVQELLNAFNDYVNKDYKGTYENYQTAYDHMFMTGQSLSTAIVAQYPANFGGTVANLWVDNTKFTVNGTEKWFDVAPFVQGDRTFVSLRALSETVGAKVDWAGETGTVTVTAGSDVLKFWIGKDYMTFNGQTRQIGTPAFIVNDRTQIPLRFIAEQLGWNVDWNGGTNSITLTKF